MSVTFTLEDNEEYCRANNLLRHRVYDCMCADPSSCSECDGTGKVCFEDFPFNLNLANVNAARVWKAFGLNLETEYGWIGEIDAYEVLKGVEATDPASLERAVYREPNYVLGGVNAEQAERYLKNFRELAEEGIRRGKKIIWA